MADKWTLIGDGKSVESLNEGNLQFGFNKSTLMDGKRSGVDVVQVQCGSTTASIIPTRGMGIHQIKMEGIDIGWNSPIQGPIHPNFVPLDAADGLGWLDGFDETMVRCGLLSNGAPEFLENGQLKYGLHGKIANTPASQVEIELDSGSESILLRGKVEEARFHFHRFELETTYEFSAKESKIRIVDQITNLGGRTGNIQLLYHWNFGTPILEAGSRFSAPIKIVSPRNLYSAQNMDAWTRYQKPQSGYQEEVFFAKLLGDNHGNTTALLTNADESAGIALHFNVQELPCFTLWKNTVDEKDGYVTGLEPGINFPNTTSFERQHDRTVTLEPGASYSAESTLEFCQNERLLELKNQIERLQTEPPRVESQPVNDWASSD